MRFRRRAGQWRDWKTDDHPDEPGAEQREPRDADAHVEQSERDVPRRQRARVPADPEGRRQHRLHSLALNGAVGIETTDFKIAIDSPELSLPTPFNIVSTHRLNYNEQLQASATESVEGAN